MVQDTIHTKKLSDKIKIWYGSTSWRPADVIENNPNQEMESLTKKYNPPLNREQKIFGVFQIFSIVILAATVIVTVSSQTYQETSIFGLIFVLTIILISSILQNKENSFNIQLFFSSGLVLLILSGSVVSTSLLASQVIIVHALINILYIVIGIPIQKYSLRESVN